VLRRITENPNIVVRKGGNNEDDPGTGSWRCLEQVMRWESVFNRQREQPEHMHGGGGSLAQLGVARHGPCNTEERLGPQSYVPPEGYLSRGTGSDGFEEGYLIANLWNH
jgi:hypothetical protein